MKILVVADIHGNLPALESVLGEVANADMVLCAGDVSGYFPYVNEVVALLAKHRNCQSVMGNHDAVLLDERLTTGSHSADLALCMQRDMINPESRAYIAALPKIKRLHVDGKTITLFHGSPTDHLNGRDAYWKTTDLVPGIYVSGHTHIPNYHECPIRDTIIINPGGTGFPRDGNPQASFAVLDTRDWCITFHRVAYNIARLVKKCTTTGLPPHFAKSIERGIWVHYNES